MPASQAEFRRTLNAWEGALVATGPARPIHLLRLSHRHRRQDQYICCVCHIAIAGKPPPTVWCQARDPGPHQSGGRRLADDEASKTSTPAAPVPSPSPASRLPQSGVRPDIQGHINPVGGCSAGDEASKTSTSAASVPSPSPASRLPQSGVRHEILGHINPVGGCSAGDEASKTSTSAAPDPSPSPASRLPQSRCQARNSGRHQSGGRLLCRR